ncbi:hypothetical protein CFOL_v3_00026 [Cephalotus follicularis]|uniref:UBN2_3 domain-containing protein n=1 Tax=Cephalotus follicularis TaxID=3775 RepID=A0A1Q3ALC1_CEPFO|nr:hypothetical protein CFOL_v3_00026 [Cephalotus follicularis]
MHEPAKYRILVRKLNYLTVTRTDISFAIDVVSQFMSATHTTHWNVVLQIVKYLKNACGRGLLFKNYGLLQNMSHLDDDKRGTLQMIVYSDADYAGCPMHRWSNSGNCLFVESNLVYWRSKKQPLVSRSSAEAKYRARAHVVGELTWVRMLLADIGYTAPQTTSLHCDNQSAIHIATNFASIPSVLRFVLFVRRSSEERLLDIIGGMKIKLLIFS